MSQSEEHGPYEDHDVRALSRRRALAVGGGIAAAAAAASVGAAAPVSAAEAEPQREALAHRQPVTIGTLSLAQAKAVLRAAEQAARAIGVPMFIQVVDVCGDVKASSRQDGNSRASLTLAPLKAQTALAFRTPTGVLAERVAADPVRLQSFLTAGFTLLGGGIPLALGGQVVGAIGVGGGSPEQDIQVAQAGAHVLA